MPFDSTDYQPTDDVLRVLETARDYVHEKWQGHHTLWNIIWPGSIGTTHCAHLAVGRAVKALDPRVGTLSRAMAALMSSVGVSDVADLWTWNDARGRKKAEVLAAFDRAIAARRAEVVEELTRAA